MTVGELYIWAAGPTRTSKKFENGNENNVQQVSHSTNAALKVIRNSIEKKWNKNTWDTGKKDV